MSALTVGSLFSGIGGLDLGLERAGMRVIWQSEIDPFACRVLARHWPDVPNLSDVTSIDWSNVERPDVICGGYPCQPFSLNGNRGGENDPRHLWPAFAAAIRNLRPDFALLENVPGHLSLGFDRVLGDLAELGFDAEWSVLPAAAVGAPHLRERVIVMAYAQGGGWHERSDGDRAGATGQWISLQVPAGGGGRSRLIRRWPPEPDVGRVADGVPDRVDRLHALGNAVVPQVAELIGRRIVESAAVAS